MEGNIIDVTKDYLSNRTVENIELANVVKRKGNGLLKFTKAVVECNDTSNGFLETFKDIKITIYYAISNEIDIRQARIDLGINNYMGDRVAWMSSDVVENQLDLKSGKIEFTIKQTPLAPGDYNFNVYSEINREVADWLAEVMPFTIIEKDYYNTGKLVPKNQGDILLNYSVY
ncbi:hypothetical protein D3C85_1167550 [compost metagenome]